MVLKEIPPEVLREFAAHAARKREHLRNYGHVRPVLSVDHKGYKFVAVGNALYYDKRWKTFPDFLISYVHHVFGSGWWLKESEKAAHPLVAWHQHLRRQGHWAENRRCRVVPGGTVAAYLELAYDLYVLRNHGKLQREVVRRLRLADHFLGARYELSVAAAFVRAGFQIDYENERDSTRTHPEFVATDPVTGSVVAVEAKLRHRDPESVPAPPWTGRLLAKAARKRTPYPFIVFVELALPHQADGPPTWASAVQEELVAATEGRQVFDLAMFTNIPHQFTPQGRPDVTQQIFALWPRETSRIPADVIERLALACQQCGIVPSDFPMRGRD